MCCAIATLAKVVLFILNLLIVIVGLIPLVVGALLCFGAPLIQNIINQVGGSATSALQNSGAPSVAINVVQLVGAVPAVATAGAILMAIGAVIVALGLFGCVAANCCCSCCTPNILLLIYGIIMSVITIAYVLLVILVFALESAIDAAIQKQLASTITNYYVDVWQLYSNPNQFALLWNVAMAYLQ